MVGIVFKDAIVAKEKKTYMPGIDGCALITVTQKERGVFSNRVRNCVADRENDMLSKKSIIVMPRKLTKKWDKTFF